MDQEQKQQPKRSPLVLVLIIIIVVLAAAAVVLVVGKFGEKEPEPVQIGDASTPLIGYEEGVTVVDDPDALQKAVDDALAKSKEQGVPIEFANYASSTDGTTFECYFANPVDSPYDVYLQVFSDVELTDQLYLSGLIPPGKAMRELKLDHALAQGDHTVYLAYTQVEDDHATIHGQALVTAVFSVTK